MCSINFAGNNILSLSYVGTLGRHLQQNVNINQVPVGSGTQERSVAGEYAGL